MRLSTVDGPFQRSAVCRVGKVGVLMGVFKQGLKKNSQ